MDGRRAIAVIAILAVMTTGCGSSAPSGGAAGAVASGGPAAGAAPTPASPAPSDDEAAGVPPALLAAVGDGDLDRATLAERDARAWLDERTGLAAAIGQSLETWLQETRSAHVSAALEANDIDLTPLETVSISTAQVASLDLPVTAFAFGWIGAGAGGMGLVESGVRLVSSGQTPGPTQPRTYTDTRTEGDTRLTTTTNVVMSLTVSGSHLVGDIEITEDTSATSVSTGAATGRSQSRNHIRVEADVCPDANGGITVAITSDMSSSGDGGAFDLSSTVTGHATVNDAAYLASEERTIDTSMTGTDASGATRSGRAALTISSSYGANGQGSTTTGTSFTVDGDYPPREAGATMAIGSLMAGMALTTALERAQEAWRSGTCVEIRATESSRDVPPRATIPFTVRPRHRIEGVDLSKSVVAAFGGEQSVSPVDVPVPAPADFTFSAGTLDGHRGTVTLTSTSNRGIGTLAIIFTVKVEGWTIEAVFTNQVGASGTVRGRKCGSSLGGAWKAVGTYTFQGFDGRQTWRIDLNPLAGLSPAGDPVYVGDYTYVDQSKGPYGVTQRTDVTGTIEATEADDGTVTMKLTESTRRQRSKAPGGGWGYGPAVPIQVARDLVWTPGATC